MFKHSSVCFMALALSACGTCPHLASRDDAQVAAVRKVAEELFDVIRSKDVAAGTALVIPEATLVSVAAQDGRRKTRTMSFADWLAHLPAQSADLREAFVGEPRVLLEGDVAVVWGRYVFEIDGVHSHGGIDALTLVRTDDGWKMSGGSYSVER